MKWCKRLGCAAPSATRSRTGVTAGERERRSLEFLLATPARAPEIVFGKFLAVSAFNLTGTAFCTVIGLLILDRSALPALGVRLDAGLLTTLQVVAWLAPCLCSWRR
jgi:sodium transport system permease protein